MNYIKDDYADQDWDDQCDQKSYDDQEKDLSDYEGSEDQEKKIKPHSNYDDEKVNQSDDQKKENDDLQSFDSDLQEGLTLFDMIPEKIKEDLGLEDEYGGDEKKPNSERITSPFISKYEKAIVIGKRAKQISKNSPIFIDITEDELKKSTAIHIAQMEYDMDRIPMIIRRYLPDGTFEDWKFKELKKLSW